MPHYRPMAAKLRLISRPRAASADRVDTTEESSPPSLHPGFRPPFISTLDHATFLLMFPTTASAP